MELTMRYQHIIFCDNPNEVDPFLDHLDSTPAEDQHIVAGQWDYGDDDHETYDQYPVYPGDQVDCYGDYVVVRNVGLTHFTIYRDNENPVSY